MRHYKVTVNDVREPSKAASLRKTSIEVIAEDAHEAAKEGAQALGLNHKIDVASQRSGKTYQVFHGAYYMGEVEVSRIYFE